MVSFILLKKKEPNLARPLNIKGGVKIGVVILVVVCIYFILYMRESLLSAEINPEIIITVIWAMVGLVLTAITRKKRQSMDIEEVELAVFGERFARKGEKYEK